jgi:hypothetical protein
MPKIVATIQVADLAEWEERFRTHGELFRRQTINGQYDYAMVSEGNRVVLCADVGNVDTFFNVLESAEAEHAKEFDGVKRETIEFFVLDRQFKF